MLEINNYACIFKRNRISQWTSFPVVVAQHTDILKYPSNPMFTCIVICNVALFEFLSRSNAPRSVLSQDVHMERTFGAAEAPKACGDDNFM